MSDDAVKKDDVDSGKKPRRTSPGSAAISMIINSLGILVTFCILAAIWGYGAHTVYIIFKAFWELAG